MATSAVNPDVAAGLGGTQTPGQASNGPPAPTPPLQPGPQAHRGILSDILHAVGDALGGPKDRDVVDPATGNVNKVPLSRGERIAGGIARGILGAGAGMSQHGPGSIGRSMQAGAAAEANVEAGQREKTQQESQNVRQGIEQRATIAYHNNQMLMQQREADRMDTEVKAKIADSNRSFALLLQQNGGQQPPILMNGKDINGQPGNEADMMKFFSGADGHKAPDGYSYLYVPTTTEDGKMSHTVYQVPINTMKQPITLSGKDFKDQTGVEPPSPTVSLTMENLIALRAKKTADDLQQTQEKRAAAEANRAEKLLPSQIAESHARAANLQAGATKDIAEAKALGGAQLDTPDVTGFKPDLPLGGVKVYNKRLDSYKKNIDQLAGTEATYQQFSDVLSDINAGKDMTGAQSVVALFNAIGISVEPLRGKGMRINKNIVADHQEARSFGQDLYQKWLSLKKGDIITPQQVKDYAGIASQVRTNQYVNLINQMHADGVKADTALGFLKGNGRQIDDGTIKIFIAAAGGDPQKGAAIAHQMGWK